MAASKSPGVDAVRSDLKPRAARNRTLTLTDADRSRLRKLLVSIPPSPADPLPPGGADCLSCFAVPQASGPRPQAPISLLHGDSLLVAPRLPAQCVDLLVLDPPYNLNKNFGAASFLRRSVDEYTDYLGGVLDAFLPALKPTATVYICGDWFSSVSIYEAAARRLVVRNRITWEREKGRGARSNWKNASEDIWFCTVSDEYTFNVDAVKLRRKVLAPYTRADGSPKDWERGGAEGGAAFRETHPSNLWSDITIPFWSMPENTDHPTQKSEKLIAKLMLASSREGDLVLDPFLGSGASAAVARKLNRRCLGIEMDEEYCLLAARRVELADEAPGIQGYADGIFYERNSQPRGGRGQ